jgi:serine/threonine protein kinase
MSTCPICQSDVHELTSQCEACGASLDNNQLPAGSMLNNRYEIGSVLGRGGFSLTYKAKDKALNRVLAIKELFPENAIRTGPTVTVPKQTTSDYQQSITGFLNEAQTLAQFDHPNIVGISDTFQQHNTAYIVMDFVEGDTLEQIIESTGKLDWGYTQHIIIQVAKGLAQLHAQNTIHRDIKPANIIVNSTGKATILDFGAARRVTPNQSHALTRIITPQYAAPEQRLTNARFGPPTDIFALATVAYQATTGSLPPSIDDRLLTGVEPTPPHEANSNVPLHASQAILQALHLNPTHRPQTTFEFVNQLTRERTPTTVTNPEPVAAPVEPRQQPALTAPEPVVPVSVITNSPKKGLPDPNPGKIARLLKNRAVTFGIVLPALLISTLISGVLVANSRASMKATMPDGAILRKTTSFDADSFGAEIVQGIAVGKHPPTAADLQSAETRSISAPGLNVVMDRFSQKSPLDEGTMRRFLLTADKLRTSPGGVNFSVVGAQSVMWNRQGKAELGLKFALIVWNQSPKTLCNFVIRFGLSDVKGNVEEVLLDRQSFWFPKSEIQVEPGDALISVVEVGAKDLLATPAPTLNWKLTNPSRLHATC